MYDMSKYAAKGGKGFGPLVPEVDWYWLVAKMTEVATPRELRSTSDVVKKANLGITQHGMRECTLWQVAECRDMNADSGFFWPVEIPNRQRWVKEWGSDGFDRKVAEHDLCAISGCVVDDLHRKYGEVNDSLASEQAKDWLTSADLSGDSSSMDRPGRSGAKQACEPKRDMVGRPTNVSA